MSTKKPITEKDMMVKSTDIVAGVQDDQFFDIRNEFEQVRAAPTMYLNQDGTGGAMHLFKEIFNNALDECNNDHSTGKKNIYIDFSENEQRISVADQGRGIPTDVLVDAVMKKHYTTKVVKYSTSRNKKQTGLNGVGMTITAALTDFMELTTFRGTQAKTIRLLDGVLHENPPVTLKTPMHGMLVTIIPSAKYLGEYHITEDMISDFCRNMSYIIDPGIVITLNLVDKKKKREGTTVYKYQGLAEAVKYMSSTLEVPPIDVSISTETFDLSMSFSYDRNIDGTMYTSFGNFVQSTEGGTHEQLALKSICEYFTREAKRQDPSSRLEVGYEDCKSGLLIAVNLEHVTPRFEGQHKSKISNKDVMEVGKKILYDELYKVMNNNPGTLKRILSYLKNVAKARNEAHKIKGVSVKKQTTFLEDAEIPKFWPVSDRNGSGYRELFLCEGDSAAGAINNCKNPHYQAVLTINGVTNNVYGLTINQLLHKQTFQNLLNVLGCGVGKNFDITKLRYNKVIICTDQDVDGYNITSLLLCFFIEFLPDLVKAGKVFKAMPALYLLDETSLKSYIKSSRTWLYDKIEYYDLLNKIIVNNAKIYLQEPDTRSILGKKTKYVSTPLNKFQAKEWLDDNAEYLLELNNLGKKAACDTTIIEYVCYYKKVFPNKNDFEKAIIKTFPEMTYDYKTESLRGSLNGNIFSLICDDLFMRSARRYLKEMEKNPSIFVAFTYKDETNEKNPPVCTIGEFLMEMGKMVSIKIDQRFKGLGEAEASLLFLTTTNPKFRKLYRVTVGDMKNAKATFELLHGKNEALRERRRQLIDDTPISYADIDN